MSEKSSSVSFAQALQIIVDNDAESARGILEERAPGLLYTRDFIVAASAVLAQQVAAEMFERVLEPQELAKLQAHQLMEIQSRVRPIMLEVFDERPLENALGYRRR